MDGGKVKFLGDITLLMILLFLKEILRNTFILKRGSIGTYNFLI